MTDKLESWLSKIRCRGEESILRDACQELEWTTTLLSERACAEFGGCKYEKLKDDVTEKGGVRYASSLTAWLGKPPDSFGEWDCQQCQAC